MSTADWTEAACRGASSPDLFFPKGTAGANLEPLAAPARAYCRRCPLITQCLKYALEWDVDGIWGGTTANQRRQLRAQFDLPAPRSLLVPHRGDDERNAAALADRTDRTAAMTRGGGFLRRDRSRPPRDTPHGATHPSPNS